MKKRIITISLFILLGFTSIFVYIKEALASEQKQVIPPVSYEQGQGVTVSGKVVDEYKDSGLIPACNESGEWGYVNENGEEVVPYQYTEAFGFWENGLAKVRSGEKYGLINELGVVLAQTVYDEMGDFGANGLILVRQGRRYNFLNSFGMCEFETVGEFTEDGVAPAKRDGKYYFIDKRGNRVNDRTYDSVSVMDKGKMYEVRCGAKFGAVNGKGEEVIPAVYDGMYPTVYYAGIGTLPAAYDSIVSKDVYAYIIWNGALYGVADENGKMLCEVKYKNIKGINKEKQIIIVQNENDVWEYRNLDNELIKELKYDHVELRYGVIVSEKGKSTIFNNVSLNTVVEHNFEWSLAYDDFFIFQQDDKYGVMDYEKKLIAEPIYDKLQYAEDGEYFMVTYNGKYGCYTKDMQEIIPCQFEEAYLFGEDGLTIAGINGKQCVINKKGQIVIAPIYNALGGIIGHEYIKALKGEKWGLLNKKGDICLDFIYDEIVQLSVSGGAEYIRVIDDEKGSGLFNKNLEMLLPVKYKEIGYSEEYECIYAVDQNDIRHYFDKSGKELFPVYYGASKLSDDGLVSVNSGEGFTIYDIGGDAVRYFEYKNVGCFYNGLARVEDWDGSVGFMNENGEKVTEFEFSDAWDFSEDGLAAVCKNGKWGFIDEAGNNVAECIYDEVWDFDDGRAAVCRNGKWGYIDVLGNEVIPLEYDSVGPFVAGDNWLGTPVNAIVTIGSGEDEQSYMINYAGEIVREIE